MRNQQDTPARSLNAPLPDLSFASSRTEITMKRLSRVFSASPKPIPPKEAEVAKLDTTPVTPKSILEDRSIDEARPLRVIVIGAGISGILACIRFVQRIPNLELCIYDKNADIGGTWVENRYPGCACGRFYLLFFTLRNAVANTSSTSRHPSTHLPGYFRA